jgi:hypothetical protein
MVDINQTLNVQNSIFGLATYGQDVFLNDTNNLRDGLYYTKIFKKVDTDIWHRLAWLDNQILTGKDNTLGQMKIEVRTRTGNALPIKDYTTNTRYTLEEINDVIVNQDINEIDTIIERATLNRSIISNLNVYTAPSGTPITGPPDMVTSTGDEYERLGTSYNSFRINNTDDTIWNYWSLPIINSPSFIPENREYDYLQARIALQSNDNITLPKMFRINFTSILKTNAGVCG